VAPALVQVLAEARHTLGTPACGCLLVHGSGGSGKTALLSAVAHAVRTSPAALARTVRVDARAAVGRKMAAVLRALRYTLMLACSSRMQYSLIQQQHQHQ
jgi:chromosomal replication initiation ATPase DnaA